MEAAAGEWPVRGGSATAGRAGSNRLVLAAAAVARVHVGRGRRRRDGRHQSAPVEAGTEVCAGTRRCTGQRPGEFNRARAVPVVLRAAAVPAAAPAAAARVAAPVRRRRRRRLGRRGRPARGGSGGSSGGAGRGGSGGGGGSAGSGSGPEPFVFGVPPAAAARFKKGINLGNRLEAPNEGDWGGTVQAEDFPFIAKRGFDHVRIPIRFSGHASAASPYTIDAAFFSRIDTVLNQAAAANLAVVLDMHAYDELAADVATHRDRFAALWTQIAARYQSRPDTVAFELLNEPNTQLDTTWNDVMLPAIRAIRATNPRRLLIVDSVFWADPTKLSTLTLPDDANIIASIHLYEPKLFTFQGQDWMGPIYLTTGVIFPVLPRQRSIQSRPPRTRPGPTSGSWTTTRSPPPRTLRVPPR